MDRNERIDLDLVKVRIAESGAETLLTRGEASALMTERLIEQGEDRRSVHNRIGMQIDRACTYGDDVYNRGLARTADGRFTIDEIRRFAEVKYPETEWGDLPLKSRNSFVTVVEGISAGDVPGPTILPGSLERSHEMILELLAKIDQMEANAAAAEVARKQKLGARFKKE